MSLRRFSSEGFPIKAGTIASGGSTVAADSARRRLSALAAGNRLARPSDRLRFGAAGGVTTIAARLRDPRAPVALLAAAMAVSAVVLLVLETHITFFLDDWAVLLHRRGLSADVILDPTTSTPRWSRC